MSRLLTKILEQNKSYTRTELTNSYNALAKSNPSILLSDGVCFVNVRCINYISYVSTNDIYYKHINGWISSDKVSSDNRIYYIDNNALSNDAKDLDIQRNNYIYSGLEDAIFVNWNNKKYLCGSRCDINFGRAVVCIYRLDENFAIDQEIIVKDDNSNVFEKHWSPVEDKPFTFIRWSNPTEIVTINPETGDILNREVKPVNNNVYKYLRGNCQTVKYKDGYLSIVHDTKRYMNYNSKLIPSYKHYFVQYDKDLNIIRTSKPFNFEVNDIEFCCGLQLKDNIVYISYSVYDAIPVLIQFDEDLIDFLFDNIKESPDISIEDIYKKADVFLEKKCYYEAASCYSRIFSKTKDTMLEYNSLMKFCICLLAIKQQYGNNIFSDINISSFLDTLLVKSDNKAEPYYLYTVFSGITGDFVKKKFYEKQYQKYRFEFPEIKRHLKIW